MMTADHINDNQTSQTECPFVVEHRRPSPSDASTFRPAARMVLDPSLRTTGLLYALPAEELKSLVFLLTFLHPNGACSPSVPELASAMRLSARKVQARLRRLTEIVWNDHPVALELRRETGLVSFSVSPHLVRHHTPPPDARDDDREPLDPGRRDAVIAYTREHFTRPRAEVERAIAEQMGWPDPEFATATDGSPSGDSADTKRLQARLAGLGLHTDSIAALLHRYGADRVRKQLDWLPFRNPKRPDRLVVTAIEEDYEEPLVLRHHPARGAPKQPPERGASTEEP